MFVCCLFVFFFFKQKTAYEMRISDWSSDVCSSDLADEAFDKARFETTALTDDLLAAYTALRQAQPPPPEIEQEAQPVATPAPVAGAALPLFRVAMETGVINPADYAAMWVHGEALQGGSSNQLGLPRGGPRFTSDEPRGGKGGVGRCRFRGSREP